jgi:diguanylate cyclase (GGDEF)-like protein
MELRYKHKRGHIVWALLSVTMIRDSLTNSINLIFQIQDITDRKRAEERLLHEAFHDGLTGLPNRALFMDHLKLSVERGKRREDRLFAVLFLDLDRFKVINDSLGHMVGDQLLVGIARRLETCLRPGDTVARLGGDEFTVLLEDLMSVTEAIDVADRLQKALALPFNLNGHEVFATVSIGIALSSTGYDRPEEVLRDADTAMYRAKMLGKARHEVFDKTMHARAMNLLQMEADLRRAIERKEFFLHYQPIVALESGTISGFEALIRWQHPERGFVPPDEFISIAEETGLIVPIGQWVLEEACRQIHEWQEQYPQYPPLQISVNLSGKQFANANLIDQISRVLRETEVEPHSLKLEITESMVMENIDTAIEMLKQLRTLGIELSIDDFGTGYSSLSYLHRFPISTLKIDRSFVSRMSDNNENAEIVRTILMLARSLKMDVVAEGVETTDQLSQLAMLECDYGQGYYFSRPLNVEGASKLLAERHVYQIALPALDSFIEEGSILAA